MVISLLAYSKAMSPCPAAVPRHRAVGFTLVELLVVIAVIGILLVAAISMVGGTPAEARKTTADMLMAMVDEARSTAITTRSHVVFAVETPPDAGSAQRVGLFRAPDLPDGPLDGIQLEPFGRWRVLETGVILIGGADAGFDNPLDGAAQRLRHDAAGGARSFDAHIVVFDPHGGLRLPDGDSPVTLRLAEGAIRSGQPQPVRRGGRLAETKLRVGRTIARAHLAN